jgi:hypothetical protein
MAAKTVWLGVFALYCVSAPVAHAQDEGVAKSGMEQGEASINVRSDVKLGIKGTAGTTSDRLAKLGVAVGDLMGDLRTCYRKQVATSPEVIGALRVTLSLRENQKPEAVVEEKGGASTSLGKCVAGVLGKASYSGVGRPAAAVLSLDFDNTRARGQTMMNQRVAQTSAVQVQAAADGGQSASWSTDGSEVTFTVRAAAGTPHEALELLVRGFHSGYAGFLDCRRHCEKGGVSPEGDIEAALQLDRQGKATVTVGKVSVSAKRAPQCAKQSFKHVSFEKPAASVRADVTVHFAR